MNFRDRLATYADTPDACWLWPGKRKPDGYVRINWAGGLAYAHRLAYELLVGPIADGMQIDHLCRVRHCMNPRHMEPVTHQENIRRSGGITNQHAVKTHCPRGHEYSEENTRWYQGRRYCRACHKEQSLERYHARRAADPAWAERREAMAREARRRRLRAEHP